MWQRIAGPEHFRAATPSDSMPMLALDLNRDMISFPIVPAASDRYMLRLQGKEELGGSVTATCTSCPDGLDRDSSGQILTTTRHLTQSNC
jgi:hypothetical protein